MAILSREVLKFRLKIPHRKFRRSEAYSLTLFCTARLTGSCLSGCFNEPPDVVAGAAGTDNACGGACRSAGLQLLKHPSRPERGAGRAHKLSNAASPVSRFRYFILEHGGKHHLSWFVETTV